MTILFIATFINIISAMYYYYTAYKYKKQLLHFENLCVLYKQSIDGFDKFLKMHVCTAKSTGDV